MAVALLRKSTIGQETGFEGRQLRNPLSLGRSECDEAVQDGGTDL